MPNVAVLYKKLSYRREIARQLRTSFNVRALHWTLHLLYNDTKWPHISKISERWCCIMWIITKFSGSTPVRRPLCSKHSPAKIRTNLLCPEITVHWPHFSRSQLRPMFIQWRMASSESHNILAVSKAHFKLNRAYKVIQGHRYLCRQKSRTVRRRNVQLMPTIFLKI